MTLSQAQAELNLVNQAITSLLTGGLESYTVAGRSATKLKLSDLREQRKELELLIARLNGGIFTVARFRNPE